MAASCTLQNIIIQMEHNFSKKVSEYIGLNSAGQVQDLPYHSEWHTLSHVLKSACASPDASSED
jgi:hypothetical protein